MMPILICEDIAHQRQQIVTFIKNYVLMEELDMQVDLATDDPFQILEYLKMNPNRAGIYFLDIDLNDKMNGLELAAQIRAFDDIGKIIFVTSHADLAPVTFQYKVEAYDFIVKGNLEQLQEQIVSCLHSIDSRKSLNSDQKALYVFKSGSKTRSVNQQEILFFETMPAPHVIGLQTTFAHYKFYGRLKDVQMSLPSLVRVHKSILANLEQVTAIDTENYLLEFQHGQTCPVAISKIRRVHKEWQAFMKKQKRRS